jgi:hypothetical protein
MLEQSQPPSQLALQTKPSSIICDEKVKRVGVAGDLSGSGMVERLPTYTPPTSRATSYMFPVLPSDDPKMDKIKGDA